MYLKEIVTYLLYPALIVASLYLIKAVLQRYEKEVGSVKSENDQSK